MGFITLNLWSKEVHVMKLRDVKVGDKYRFRTWDNMLAEFGLSPGHLPEEIINCKYCFLRKMENLCEKVITISRIRDTKITVCFEDGRQLMSYSISADMLEPLVLYKLTPTDECVVGGNSVQCFNYPRYASSN